MRELVELARNFPKNYKILPGQGLSFENRPENTNFNTRFELILQVEVCTSVITLPTKKK